MSAEMTIPVGWMLTAVLGLAGVIATLAGIIYRLMLSRLTAQDKIIESMRKDIERLVKGCGIKTCLWRNRCDNDSP